MSSTGNRIFRSALLAESALNIGSIILMITNPELVLSYFVKGPAQITPAAKALTQWMGAIIVLATAPLVLAYPEASSGESAASVTARRRLAYIILGAGEVALGLVMVGQYITGDSGITDTALLTATSVTATLPIVRGYFLFGRPQFMEAQGSAKKLQ